MAAASTIIADTFSRRLRLTPIGQLHDFIDALPATARVALDEVSSERSLPADSRLMRAGSQPREVFQIRSGRVKYSCWDHLGRETVLTHMTSGDWVGLSELFSDLPALWNVVALTPITVRVIGRRDFVRLVDSHPALSRQLLKVFAQRFSLHRLFGLDHSALSLKERLAKMLYVLSFSHQKDAKDNDPIVMKLSQEELGKVVGASRQKLNPALKALEREQILDVQFGGIRLRSRASIIERYGHLLAPLNPGQD